MAKKKSKRQVPIWSCPLAIWKRLHLKISVYLSALNAPLLSYPGELFANRCQDISSPNVWAILYLMHLRKGRIMNCWNWGKGKIKICWLGQANPNFRWNHGLDLNIPPNLTFCPQPLFLFYPRLARRVLSQSPALLALLLPISYRNLIWLFQGCLSQFRAFNSSCSWRKDSFCRLPTHSSSSP